MEKQKHIHAPRRLLRLKSMWGVAQALPDLPQELDVHASRVAIRHVLGALVAPPKKGCPQRRPMGLAYP